MGSAVGALDLPSEPEEPDRADHVRDRGADQPKARDVPGPARRGGGGRGRGGTRPPARARARGGATRRGGAGPDPGERGRAYEAMRAHVSAEAGEEARPVRPAEGSYWHEAPGCLDQAAAHRKRGSADRQPAPDRAADPPGSFRSHGGSYLNPERHTEAVTTLARGRAGAPATSAAARRLVSEKRA